jgi:hypothetical protein
VASSSATAVEGSSPSQDRFVDFLQSTQVRCQSSSTTTSATTREDPTLTSLTGIPSRSGHRGCWRCPPVQLRRAPPLAHPLLQGQPQVQHSPAPLRPPLLLQQQQAPCSLEEQGASAPSAPRALQQWGLGYDSQWLPPPCPTRLRRPARRAPSAATPTSKETSSSTSELETRVLDYTTQDGSPLGTWSR